MKPWIRITAVEMDDLEVKLKIFATDLIWWIKMITPNTLSVKYILWLFWAIILCPWYWDKYAVLVVFKTVESIWHIFL